MKPSLTYDVFMNSKLPDYLLEKVATKYITQEKLAKAIGVPKGTVNRWINTPDVEIDLASMKKIAAGLDVNLQEVVDVIEGNYQAMTQAEREGLEISNKYSFLGLMAAVDRLKEEELIELKNKLEWAKDRVPTLAKQLKTKTKGKK